MKNHKVHAEDIVGEFRTLISDEARQQIEEEHFEELTIMIESALSTAVMERVEHAADRLVALAKEFRADVEHFEH